MELKPCKFKLGDLVPLYRAFKSVGSVTGSPAFGYVASFNRRAMEPFLQSIEDAQKGDAGTENFLKLRDMLLKQCALVDPRTKMPVVSPAGQVAIAPEKEVEFNAGMAKLAEDYPEAEKKLGEVEAQINKLMETYVDISLYVLPLESIPNDVPARVIDSIFPLIKPPIGSKRP